MSIPTHPAACDLIHGETPPLFSMAHHSKVREEQALQLGTESGSGVRAGTLTVVTRLLPGSSRLRARLQ